MGLAVTRPASWCAAVADRGRSYEGAHRAPRRVPPRFWRGLRLAVVVGVVYWAVVITVGVVGGWLMALAVGVSPLLVGLVHGLWGGRS